MAVIHKHTRDTQIDRYRGSGIVCSKREVCFNIFKDIININICYNIYIDYICIYKL